MLVKLTPYDKAVQQICSNPEQRDAFQSEGSCAVLAGPGTGKTTLLTTKMAQVLRERVNGPRGLACVTYNNECVHELERRLAALGVLDHPNVFVGTLHRFCVRFVLAPFGPLLDIGVPDPLTVASERVQQATLALAMKNLRISADGFRSELDRFRRTAVDRTVGIDGWEIGDRGLTDVCLEYERLLREQGKLDFDDIVLLTMRAVESSIAVRRCLKAKLPILFVDEYQDLGLPLHRLVLALAEAGVAMFAVGDPDQSIYGFAGAHPRLLRDLSKRAEFHAVELRLNYRSGRRIVEASRIALGEQRHYVAHRADEGEVHFRCCDAGLQDQSRYVVEDVVKRHIGNGGLPGEIALLYPTGSEGDALENMLIASNVAYVRLDKGAGYRRTQFIRAVEELAAWCFGGWRNGAGELSAVLRRWRGIFSKLATEAQRGARAALIKFLLANRDCTGRCHYWLIAFDMLVIEPYVRRLGAIDADELEAFDALLEVCAGQGSLSDLDVGMFAGKSGATDRVCLMNIHTAKGTEFEVVALVGMDAGRMPLYRAKSRAELDEQRRLFFVGVSRAKREIHLTYSGWTENRYGRRFHDGPSPYLLELMQGLTEKGRLRPQLVPR